MSMPVYNERPLIHRLYRAVLDQGCDKQNCIDAANHGADSGFSGFTYYKDTCQFHDDNESMIWEFINEQANEFGMQPMEFIASFNGTKNVYDGDQLKNLLAWFILESVGQWLIEPY